MAKRKTKKQKKRIKRPNLVIKPIQNKETYHNTPSTINKASSSLLQEDQKNTTRLFMYNPAYIISDIKKTIIFSTIITLILIGMWLYLA